MPRNRKFPVLEKPGDRIIVALDVHGFAQADRCIEELAPHVWGFKLGPTLVTSPEFHRVVAAIRTHGSNLFLDLKLNDKPGIVGETLDNFHGRFAHLNPEMVTVHASGGPRMLEEAAKRNHWFFVLGVTVLTSLSEDEAYSVFRSSSSATVERFVSLASNARLSGIVCSAKELPLLNRHPEWSHLIRVVPGTRSEWMACSDHARVATPAVAIENGADYLVFGDPITRPLAGKPLEVVRRISEEIDSALNQRA